MSLIVLRERLLLGTVAMQGSKENRISQISHCHQESTRSNSSDYHQSLVVLRERGLLGTTAVGNSISVGKKQNKSLAPSPGMIGKK